MNAEIRRVPKQKRAQEKYQAILNASIVVLAREGYDGTNTSNVAIEAGVAVGSLYEYFPNKESIFTAFLDSKIADVLEIIKESAKKAGQLKHSEQGGSNDNLKTWLLLALGVCENNRDLLRVLVSEIPGVLNLISLKNLDEQLLPLAKFLADGKKMSASELNTKTYILSNTLYGFMIRSFFAETPLSVDETADELLKLITAYSKS